MKEELGQLELALKQDQQPAERLNTLLQILEAVDGMDLPRSEMLANKAIGLATQLNAPASLAKAHGHAAAALWKLAEYAQSMEHYDKALDKYLALGDMHGVAKCYIGKGIICGSLDEYRTSLEYFEHGLVASKKAARPLLSATIVGNIGNVYFQIGRYKDALDCFERGLEFYNEKEHPDEVAHMLGGMAGVYVYQGDLNKGLEYVKRTLSLHRKGVRPHGEAVALLNLGMTLRKMGRKEKAKLQLLEALAFTRSSKLKSVEFDIHQNLSQVYTELGRADESSKHLNLYLEMEKEEKQAALKRKTEQDRQRLNLRNSA
ncbi:MAG: tetratricopeptide repeat protein [Flavobacteriales bacterium]|nr:tetratricopeptide repeat protein [Flavobacteriales bacterium]